VITRAITPDVMDAIREHALSELPNACAGWILFDAGNVSVSYRRAVTVAATPFRAEVVDDQRDGELLCHSHPEGDPRPSDEDLAALGAADGFIYAVRGDVLAAFWREGETVYVHEAGSNAVLASVG
jgi:proteasome lid subunit RPN8/RPN11